MHEQLLAGQYTVAMNEVSELLNARREVWIALSDLWLDTELDDSRLDEIAAVVCGSGFSRDEVQAIFHYELAPFLGWNCLIAAGECSGFDADWVCEQAAKRMGKPSLLKRILVGTGIMTYAARDAWQEVERRAFDRTSKHKNLVTEGEE